LFSSVLRSGRAARASAEVTGARLLLLGPKVLGELRILVRLAGAPAAALPPRLLPARRADRV
jgi:hypothetical protein